MPTSSSLPRIDSDQLERLRADIEQRISDAVSELGRRLDDLQSRLPETPRKAAEFGSAAADRIGSTASGIADDVGRRIGNLTGTADSAASTAAGQARSASTRAAETADRGLRETAGQARSAASRTAKTAGRGARQTAGQARSAASRTAKSAGRGAREAAGQASAQAGKVARTADTEASALLDDAARATRPDDGSAVLEEWTKADLYERAQELDIEGRSSMSKAQLVAAIRRA